jgi:nickel/cobalt transporter (NicO) family protein
LDNTALATLSATAASIGFVHTIAGPDHYIPFIAMSRAGRWSLTKTTLITIACGLGHVASSVVIGIAGIAVARLTLERLEWFEAARGQLAGWLLLGFGLAYMSWGLRKAYRNKPHAHVHAHTDGTVHSHKHTHADEHVHPHNAEAPQANMTPWILFTIFVFGPCEALIPILMFPAADLGLWSTAIVTLAFALTTIGTMTAIVVAAHVGITRISIPWLERYAHAAAGFALAACGAGISWGL